MSPEESVIDTKKRTAQQFLQSGNLEVARSLYTEVCKLNRNDADAWFMLGAINSALGLTDDSIECNRKTIILRPDYLGAYYNLARALLTNNNAEEAIKICLQAIVIRNNYPDIHTVLGLSYGSLGNQLAAIDSFKTAIKLDPDLVEAHYNLGVMFEAIEKVPEAVESYETVIKLNPDDIRAHRKLAFIFINSDRANKALQNLSKVLELEPGNAIHHHDYATTLLMTGDSGNAVTHYERAIEIDPEFAEAYYGIGEVCLRTGKLEDIRRIVDSMSERLHGHPLMQLLLAKVERREKNYQESRRRLQELLVQGQHPSVSSKVHHELGHVLDSVGEYHSAFNEFVLAKQTLVESNPAAAQIDRQSFHRTIRANIDWFTAANTATWIKQRPDDDISSPVFLIGFPRSGTTLSEQILAAHTKVVVSDERPVLVNLLNQIPRLLNHQASYPDVLNLLTPSHLTMLRRKYWEMCEEVVGSQIRGKHFIDKLPLNTIHLGFINKVFPEAKILIAIRDPRDVCLSCFIQLFHLNPAMIQFIDIVSTAKAYDAVMNLLAHYRNVLSIDAFEYRYEDIVVNTESTARKMLAFLGLEWDEKILSFYSFERQRTITTPSVEAVATPIYSRSIGRWRNYEYQMQPAFHLLQPYVQAFGYDE